MLTWKLEDLDNAGEQTGKSQLPGSDHTKEYAYILVEEEQDPDGDWEVKLKGVFKTCIEANYEAKTIASDWDLWDTVMNSCMYTRRTIADSERDRDPFRGKGGIQEWRNLEGEVRIILYTREGERRKISVNRQRLRSKSEYVPKKDRKVKQQTGSEQAPNGRGTLANELAKEPFGGFRTGLAMVSPGLAANELAQKPIGVHTGFAMMSPELERLMREPMPSVTPKHPHGRAVNELKRERMPDVTHSHPFGRARNDLRFERMPEVPFKPHKRRKRR